MSLAGWLGVSVRAMSAQDLGKLVLRIVLGCLMLLHGLAKLRHGVAPIGAGLVAKGLPSAVAYFVYVGEVIAPILVLLGWLTRPAAVVLFINMVVAVSLAHTADLFQLGKGGGYALELQALYGFGALAIALLGAGRYSVSRGLGRWD